MYSFASIWLWFDICDKTILQNSYDKFINMKQVYKHHKIDFLISNRRKCSPHTFEDIAQSQFDLLLLFDHLNTQLVTSGLFSHLHHKYNEPPQEWSGWFILVVIHCIHWIFFFNFNILIHSSKFNQKL